MQRRPRSTLAGLASLMCAAVAGLDVPRLHAEPRRTVEEASSPPRPNAARPSAGRQNAAPSTYESPHEDWAVGTPVEIDLPGDRSLRVIHAPEPVTRTILYLHGMCGNDRGADILSSLVPSYGTVISLRGDVPCSDRPGFKWPHEPEAIHSRVQRAIERVHGVRHGRLDTGEVTVIGYSQGAHRAEKLASAYPAFYRSLALGGPPTAARPERLRHARRVAILGGELENTQHMFDGYLALHQAGIRTEFFLLPRAGHGGYGPEGRAVLARVFAFLFSENGPPARVVLGASRSP